MATKRQKKAARPYPVPPSAQAPDEPVLKQDTYIAAEQLIAFHHEFDQCFARNEMRVWSRFYLCGQLSMLVRKTIEPMVLGLHGVSIGLIRGLQHFIGQSHWYAKGVCEMLQILVGESLGEADGVLMLDGSGFPKQGKHSVGVAPQYCGHLGKIANCQHGIFVGYVSRKGYAFLDVQLYMPEVWFDAAHENLRYVCEVPKTLGFQTEPTIGANLLIRIAQRQVVPFQWIVADETYGKDPVFLDAIDKLPGWYLIEVPSDTRAWLRRPPVEPSKLNVFGRIRRKARVKPSAPAPQTLKALAASLPTSAWKTYSIREGSQGMTHAKFAFVRVTTLRHQLPGPRQWAILRRSEPNMQGEIEEKFFLSNASKTCSSFTFVRVSSLRWPIEMLFEEAKSETGMEDYETRSWMGWHHHMAQSFMSHLFLMLLRLSFKKSSQPSPPHKHINLLPKRFLTSASHSVISCRSSTITSTKTLPQPAHIANVAQIEKC